MQPIGQNACMACYAENTGSSLVIATTVGLLCWHREFNSIQFNTYMQIIYIALPYRKSITGGLCIRKNVLYCPKVAYRVHGDSYTGTCIHTYVLVRGGFRPGGFCPGFFVCKVLSSWWFLSVPLLSEYIHYNRKLNTIFNFRFHMYEIFFKSVTSHALGPLSSCHKLSLFFGPLPPRA